LERECREVEVEMMEEIN